MCDLQQFSWSNTIPSFVLSSGYFHFNAYAAVRFLFGPSGFDTGAGNSAAISSTLQTWSDTPASIAGVQRSVSRSQAKRVLARVELFKTVVFDFDGVDTVGQSFADEIFRVFFLQHPEIHLIPINMSEEVGKMVKRARTEAQIHGLVNPGNVESSPAPPETLPD